MRYSTRVKPISYLKAHAAEILATLHEAREPLLIKEYRQVCFKPYRLIYRIVASEVLVFIIADGRRDMQSLLARRLLGA